LSWPMSAQVWDNTGNGLLSGTYYFRQVLYVLGDSAGDFSDAVALYGTIAFDGQGNYSISAEYLEYQNGGTTPITSSGTYKISASGYGFMDNPVVTGASVYGMVGANGIFVGSSTDSGYNDLFVAAPLASPLPTAATFKGSYSVAYMNFPQVGATNGVAENYDAMLQFTANGAGGIGAVNVAGYIGGPGTSTFSMTESASYFTSGGAEVVTFPTTSGDAVTGQEYLYISPDGSFIFGGSPQWFDMFVGVRTGTAGNFGGNYYQAGLVQDESTLGSGYGVLNTYFGSFSASSDGSIIGHQRSFAQLLSSTPDNLTYADTFPPGSNSYTDPSTSTEYVAGDGGAIVIALGQGPYLGIGVAVQAPSFSGSGGTYIYPNGVVNAASSAPFTAGVVPGELITIYGQNLAAATTVASTPFPTTLGNVQVLINGAPVPIYVVSATQVSAQVPFGISTKIAQFQVVNNGVSYNAVTEFVYQTEPGAFTIPAGGLGYGAILHADYSLVTAGSPAQPGETVLVYVTGLGTVFPTVADGAAASSTALSQTTGTITADVSGASAPVSFAGLAPGFAGLYQINVQIPSGVTAGDNTLDISGPDSYASEALIPIGSGVSSNSAARPAARIHRRPKIR